MIIGQNSCDSMSFANLLRGACLIMREIENESEMKRESAADEGNIQS